MTLNPIELFYHFVDLKNMHWEVYLVNRYYGSDPSVQEFLEYFPIEYIINQESVILPDYCRIFLTLSRTELPGFGFLPKLNKNCDKSYIIYISYIICSFCRGVGCWRQIVRYI